MSETTTSDRALPKLFVLGLSLWGIAPVFGYAADDPAAKKTASNSATPNQEAAKAFERFRKQAIEFQQSGKITEAIAAGEKAVEVASRINGENSQTVAGWEDWLGLLHNQQADWPAAHKAYERALAIRTKLYGDNHWRVTDARWQMQTVDLLSRLTAAQRADLSQSDELMRQVRKPTVAGGDKQVISIAARAREIRQRLLGNEHPLTAESGAWLAYWYDRAGKFAEAEPFYRQALETRKKLLGLEHPETADLLNDLGQIGRASCRERV